MSFIRSVRSFFSALCRRMFTKVIQPVERVQTMPPAEQPPFLTTILKRLEDAGMPSKEVTDAEPQYLQLLVPTHLSAFEAFRLQAALKEMHATKKEQMECEAVYRKFLPYLGRIEAVFEDDTTMLGNGVLIGAQCHVVTALHTFGIADEGEEGKSGRKRKKSESERTKKAPVEIQVLFPNSSIGKVGFSAKIVASSEKYDLALLQATKQTSKLARLKGLPPFVPYHPQIDDLLVYISYPGCKGESRFSHTSGTNDDMPWFEKGIVSCYDLAKGEGLGTYTSFGGSSGALVVHIIPNSAQFRFAIHLGVYHETQQIEKWSAVSLPLVNEGLCEKAYNAYFTLNACSFMENYFKPKPSSMKRGFHPQGFDMDSDGDSTDTIKEEDTLRVQKINLTIVPAVATDAGEEVVLENLWSAWPGFEDDEDV